MRGRAASFASVDASVRTVPIKLRNGNQEYVASCLPKSDLKSDDHVFGYAHARSKAFTEQEYGTISDGDVHFDVYSRKRFYEVIVGYAKTTDGEYVGITESRLILLLILVLAAVLAVSFLIWQDTSTLEANAPEDGVSGEQIEDVQSESSPDYRMVIDLPEGDVTFDVVILIPEKERERADASGNDVPSDGNAYSGQVSIQVTMPVDGESHRIAAFEEDIVDGALADRTLDFTQLDFELKEGVTEGAISIAYPDGTTVDEELTIIVRQSKGGVAQVGYSPVVHIDLDAGAISLEYTQGESTHEAIVRLVLISGGDEYLLATSNPIQPNQRLTSLKLDDGMRSRLERGAYDGVLRVTFTGQQGQEAVGLDTDIQVEIKVE